jgi:2',5'-phosphodiesterase
MVEDSEEVQLTALLEGQMRTLNRAKSESASKALQRLLKAVGKKKSKRDKKAREDVDSGAADVQVHSADGALYSTEQLSAFTNAELWRDGVHVTVCGARLVVVVNPPAITGDVRAFPKKPMLVGYPIIASALGVEFADDVRFVWTHLPSGEKKGQGQGQEQEQGKIEEQAEAFAYVGRVFTPTAEHRNRRVKLHATPFRRTGAESESEREYVWGRTHVFYCSGEVQDAPSPCMSIVRREWLQAQHTARDGFRVMTYNILADAFATSDFSQTQLYPYVRQEHLDTSYRCQIMLREVEDHMPDIVCLQECVALPPGCGALITCLIGVIDLSSARTWRQCWSEAACKVST